jgi:hypothetical protein
MNTCFLTNTGIQDKVCMVFELCCSAARPPCLNCPKPLQTAFTCCCSDAVGIKATPSASMQVKLNYAHLQTDAKESSPQFLEVQSGQTVQTMCERSGVFNSPKHFSPLRWSRQHLSSSSFVCSSSSFVCPFNLHVNVVFTAFALASTVSRKKWLTLGEENVEGLRQQKMAPVIVFVGGQSLMKILCDFLFGLAAKEGTQFARREALCPRVAVWTWLHQEQKLLLNALPSSSWLHLGSSLDLMSYNFLVFVGTFFHVVTAP